MKTKTLLMVLFAAMVALFTSCNDVGEYAGSPIVGTWVYTSGSYTETATFTATGKYKATGKGGGISLSFEGTYIYDEYNEDLTISIRTDEGTTTAYFLCEISGDYMTLTSSTQTSVYKRK